MPILRPFPPGGPALAAVDSSLPAEERLTADLAFAEARLAFVEGLLPKDK